MDMTSYFLGKVASEGQGSGGGGSSVQSDYLQNDPAAADYIKNRPFYEITEEKTITLKGGDEFIFVEGKLGLVAGGDYAIEIVGEEGILSFPATAVEMQEGEVRATVLLVDGTMVIIDGFDSINGEVADGYSYDAYAVEGADYYLKGSFGEIKKIDKKFLPDDIATKLEIATPEILGGVMPKSVTGNPSATQDVFVDIDTGRLYTFPGKEYYKASSDNLGLVKVKELISFSEGYLPTAVAMDGTLYARSPQVDSTVVPESTNAVSGAAVYSFIEGLLAEGEY